MHIAEVVTIAKSLPLLRLNTYKSLILSYSADYRRIFRKNVRLYVVLQIYDIFPIAGCKKRVNHLGVNGNFTIADPSYGFSGFARGDERGLCGRRGGVAVPHPCFRCVVRGASR